MIRSAPLEMMVGLHVSMSILSHAVGCLAVSIALNWGGGQQDVSAMGRVPKLSVGETPKGFQKRKFDKATMAVLTHLKDPPEEGGLNLPCEILMGRTGLNHKSKPQIINLLQFLARMNGF